MNNLILYTIISAAIALAVGVLIGRLISGQANKKVKEQAEKEAKAILDDAAKQAENLKKDKLLEAKEQILQLRAAHDKDVIEKNKNIAITESRVKQKEQSLSQKTEALQRKENEIENVKEVLNRQLELVNLKKQELEKSQEENIQRLEKLAGLTAVEAKTELIEQLKETAKSEAMAYVKEIMD